MTNANQPVHHTDQELIDRLQGIGAEKRRAEDQLFNTYQYFIREGMRKYAMLEEEAFDAYADTMLSAIDSIASGNFKRLSSMKTYIYQIFHNKCVDLVRKKTTHKSSVHRTVSITDLLIEVSDPAKSVIHRLIEKNDWDFLKAKLGELGENCRQLLLFSADGHNDKQIAAALGYKTADVVKTSRLRCLEKLRQLFKHI